MLIQRRYWILAATMIVAAGGITSYVLLGQSGNSATTAPRVIQSDGKNAPAGMVWIPGGEFLMEAITKKP